MFQRSLLAILLVVGVSVAAFAARASAAPAVHFHDAGFEKPVVGPGSYQLFATGTTFAGWNVVGASGNVAVVSHTFTQNGFSFPAKFGKQWLDLTGVSNTATGVGQTLALSPGQSYTLSFWVGNVYDPGGIFGTTSTVDVLVNGTQVLAATNSRGKGTPKQVWEKFSTTFVAPTTTTSPTATIAFINGDPSNDTTNGLDGVTIVAAT
jgi:hapalindole biogenesis HpiC1 cyclase-like protein